MPLIADLPGNPRRADYQMAPRVRTSVDHAIQAYGRKIRRVAWTSILVPCIPAAGILAIAYFAPLSLRERWKLAAVAGLIVLLPALLQISRFKYSRRLMNLDPTVSLEGPGDLRPTAAPMWVTERRYNQLFQQWQHELERQSPGITRGRARQPQAQPRGRGR
jgi:hypothetical protein